MRDVTLPNGYQVNLEVIESINLSENWLSAGVLIPTERCVAGPFR